MVLLVNWDVMSDTYFVLRLSTTRRETGDFRSDPRHKPVKYRRFIDVHLEERKIGDVGYLPRFLISLDDAKRSTMIAKIVVKLGKNERSRSSAYRKVES